MGRVSLSSLRVRISLLVLLIFIPVFALVVVTGEEQREQAIDKAEADTLALAERIALDNQQHIESTRQLLETLSRIESVQHKDPEACTRFFGDVFQDPMIYVNVFVVDTTTAQSFCAARTNPTTGPSPVDITQFAWYQAVIETQKFVVSEYRIGPTTGKPIITMALPVFDDRGQVTAVIAAGLSLEWLESSIRRIDFPDETTVTLIDRSGTVLVRYPPGEGMTGNQYAQNQVLKLALSHEEGTVESSGLDGIDRLYGYTSLGADAGYISVIVSQPKPLILADAESIRDRNLAALLIVTVMVFALAWLSSGLVTRPISHLTAASRQIAKGEPGSNTPLHTEIIELQELLDAFNDMAAAVEQRSLQRLDELAALNEQLQYEVEERTRAQARTKLVQELTAGLSQAVTSDEVIQTIVRKGLLPLGGSILIVGLGDEQTRTFNIILHDGVGADLVPEYREMSFDSKLPIVDAFVTGNPVWIRNLEEYEAQYPKLFHTLDQRATRSQAMACMPLIVNKRTIGSIGVAFPTPHSLNIDFQVLLFTIAGYIGQALERAKLYEQEMIARTLAEQAAERISRLQAMTAALARAHTVEEVAEVVVEQGRAVLGADQGLLNLLIDDGSAFKLVFRSGGSELPDEDLRFWQRFPAAPAYPATDVARQNKEFWYTSPDDLVEHYPAMAELAPLYPGGGVLLPILLGEQVLGVVTFNFNDSRPFDEAERRYIAALVHQGAVALGRAQLAEQARKTATIEERQRLARDLHDAVSQTLFSSTLIAETLLRQWDQGSNSDKAAKQLNELVVLNRGAMAEMRSLLFELRPESIDKTELQELIRQLIAAAKSRKRIKAQLSTRGDSVRLPPAVHVALYRITQESINNILKHSQAAEFTVTLEQEPDRIELSIVDNGNGFDTSETHSGLGLSSMRERAEGIGAVLTVNSAPGQGAQVSIIWNGTAHTEQQDGVQMV